MALQLLLVAVAVAVQGLTWAVLVENILCGWARIPPGLVAFLVAALVQWRLLGQQAEDRRSGRVPSFLLAAWLDQSCAPSPCRLPGQAVVHRILQSR